MAFPPVSIQATLAAAPSVASAPLPAPSRAPGIWLAVYLAVLVGKYADWLPGMTNIPLAKIAILLALISAWRVRGTLATVHVRSLQVARVALAFLGLAVFSLVFSVYKSESLRDIYLIIVLGISFVLLVKVTHTLREVERLLFALCLAAAGLTAAALLSYSGGRASVGEGIDPNDLAYGLVTVLPITRALSLTVRQRIARLILNGLTVAMVIAILLTGSRGGALGLITVIVLLAAYPVAFDRTGELKRFRFGRFALLLGLMAALGVGLWGYLPEESRERMATLLDLSHDYNASSTNASRSEIWMRDSRAVLSRPIGFGFGTSDYVDGMTGGAYRALHNSFVQAFVELGVLGLILFCRSYLLTLRELRRVSSLGWQAPLQGDGAKASLYARALRLGLAGNIVCGFFLSDAYSALLWMLIAISAVLARITLPASAAPARPAART
jgi:O-antigen ligase